MSQNEYNCVELGIHIQRFPERRNGAHYIVVTLADGSQPYGGEDSMKAHMRRVAKLLEMSADGYLYDLTGELITHRYGDAVIERGLGLAKSYSWTPEPQRRAKRKAKRGLVGGRR